LSWTRDHTQQNLSWNLHSQVQNHKIYREIDPTHFVQAITSG
jgi:hypothetical protein